MPPLFTSVMVLAMCVLTVVAVPMFPGQSETMTSGKVNGVGPETVENWSEYITVNETRHMFYWFFESRSAPESDPLVLWMTGGPGCSGMVALFYENGPYVIHDDLSLSLNPYSWNSNANVIWIDQPVGSGFSYSDLGDLGVVSEKGMADNMYDFLQTFVAKYPKFQNNDFFIFGESYAGHYVPALSSHINEMNKQQVYNPINLKGAAIGNGLVRPEIQYKYYADFARMHGVISEAEKDVMKAALPVCEGLIAACAALPSVVDIPACLIAVDVCNLSEVMPYQLTGLNPYDVRIKCDVPPLCYNMSNADRFLNDKANMKALGVTRKWKSCNKGAELKLVLAGDWMQDYGHVIPQLLADGIRVLVYAGEDDFVCNWLGNQAWVDALEWAGAAAFARAANTTWAVAGETAGSFRSAEGMTFLRVKDAGHMVPMDQPAAALDMINKFVTNQPLA